METIEKASSISLPALRRYSSIVTVLAALFLLGGFFSMLAYLGIPTPLFAPSLYLSSIWLSAFLIFDILRRAHKSPVILDTRYRTGWLLMGGGLLLCSLGGPFVPLLCQAVETHNQPAFSYLAIISIFFYPLTFIALFFIAGARHWRLGMLFDALIIMLCVLSLCWFVITQSAFSSTIVTPFHKVLIRTIVLSYPANDIFLLYVVVPLALHEKDVLLRIPFLLIAGSFVANLWAHAAAAYICLSTGVYQPGTVYIDWFWQLSFVLLGLAVLYQYTGLVRRITREQIKTTGLSQGLTPPEGMTLRPDQEMPRGWRYIRVIYIPLALLLCILLISAALDQEMGQAGFIILCALTVGIISLRYFYSARVNDLLVRERDLRYREAERVRSLVAQLSDIRNLEFLRERIVTVLLTELGFTYAMLLLVEEYDGVQTNQAHLLVSMASKSMHLTKWRLQADTSSILFRTATSGKRTEIDWTDQSLPAEIRNWQASQRVPPMVFIPIVYRDKLLGSLGVAHHALTRYSRPEMAIVRQYTEQIAAILEHAYLYRQAHERETFARAMANISTRLNAAVIDLTEISQLICEEGVNALRADYVVLYLAQKDDQLLPLASSTGEDRTLSTPQQWPSFSLAEYLEETSNSHHPFLLDITQRRRMQTSIGREDENAASASTSNDLDVHDYFRSAPLSEASSTGALGRGIEKYFGPRLLALRTRLARHFIQTVILAPLMHGGEIQGILLFARATPPGTSNDLCFESSDLPHAQDFVEQAGVAFSNARLYSSLQDTHKRLQELDQLKDQFMITASHELRTPLTAVQGYIELIAQYDDALPPEQRREFLQKAQIGCEELAVLLRNVMDASRLETEAGIKPALMDRVNVLEMIEKVKVLIEPLVTHEHRTVYVEVPPYLSVMADPLRLHQVLTNISSNALKYSEPGSPIRFSARISLDQGRSVIISIADRGKGIAPEDHAQLFQRFVRLESDLNSPVRGSGLGLYISRRLVEAMGGKIWIESRGIPGEGATFHIQLPLA